jgi:hypothetical protein
VSEGEAAYLGVGAGSPGPREATGEGGEGFYIAEAAGAPICSHPREGTELGMVGSSLPVPFGRVGARPPLAATGRRCGLRAVICPPV